MWASFLYKDDSAAGGKPRMAATTGAERPVSMSIIGKPHFATERSEEVQTPTFASGYFRSNPPVEKQDVARAVEREEQDVLPVEKTIRRVEHTGPPAITIQHIPSDTKKRPTSAFFQTAPPRLDATSNACASNTAPPSAGTGRAGGSSTGTGALSGSGNGAEKHGYLSFSDVKLDDEDQDDDERAEVGSWGSYGSFTGGTLRGSGRISREVLQRRLKKRTRAWNRFSAVMQDHGLRVRKHHRRGKGWADRVVKYDPELPGLRWKSSKWWDSNGGQLPLRDVLDVERSGKIVWVKCLHLGTVGFEASNEQDSIIFYLAMDKLLNKRCGVDDRAACIPGPMLS